MLEACGKKELGFSIQDLGFRVKDVVKKPTSPPE